MSIVSLTTKTTANTLPGVVFFFALPIGATAGSFLRDQLVSVQVYGRLFTGLTTLFGSAIGVNWPANAPYALPPGEYNIDFTLKEPSALPAGTLQVASQKPAAAADVAALKAQLDTLLNNMATSGVMQK